MSEDTYEPPTPGELQTLLHRLVESPDEAMQGQQGQFTQLLSLLEVARERLYELCRKPLPQTAEPAKPRSAPTGPEVGQIFFPIGSIHLGGHPPQAPLTVRTKWSPSWKLQAEERIANVNMQLLDGEHGFVDREGTVHNPSTLDRLTTEFVGAVCDTLEFQLRPHGFVVPHRPSELEPLLAEAKKRR